MVGVGICSYMGIWPVGLWLRHCVWMDGLRSILAITGRFTTTTTTNYYNTGQNWHKSGETVRRYPVPTRRPSENLYVVCSAVAKGGAFSGWVG